MPERVGGDTLMDVTITATATDGGGRTATASIVVAVVAADSFTDIYRGDF